MPTSCLMLGNDCASWLVTSSDGLHILFTCVAMCCKLHTAHTAIHARGGELRWSSAKHADSAREVNPRVQLWEPRQCVAPRPGG